MADPVAITTQFTEFFYGAWQTDRSTLASLYRPTSTLTWEGQVFTGGDAIIEKIKSLPFTKVVFKVETKDPQLSGGGMLILTTGQLLVDDSTNPLHFSQLFFLMPEGTSFYVLNDVFRLNYG
ncbi:putative nuclear transport factor 2 [Ceratobasidium sp. AG-I]|nr:putative nuclear transport factor 2 [Ceratobasidium sp. AG-I]